jgi:hypothetical protein
VICGAVTITDPASPLAVELAEATIPLAVSLNVSGPRAVTCTEPPLPGPAVVLAICAPPVTVQVSAVTVTGPPAPDCSPVAEAAMRVSAPPAPSVPACPAS